jgi:hypothetical protein
MKELIVVVTLAVIASPAASMTLKSNNNAVWIDYEAMKGADRLINAGVSGWDPSRLLPFLSCVAEPGTEITVTATHAFYGYAEVVVASQKCAGVVHLEAIDTAAEARDAEARNAKARDAFAQEKALQEQRWIIGCKPIITPDKLGVQRYHYAAEGCEFGNVPPLTPGQEAQATKNAKAKSASAQAASDSGKALQEQRSLIGCKPVVAPDKYGVQRYHYAAEGCEFDIVPPLTPEQEAQAIENVKAAEAQTIAQAQAQAQAQAPSIPSASSIAAMAKEAGTTPEAYRAMRKEFERAGVSGEGFDRLIGGISQQVKEDYPEMMENIRTDDATREEAARRLRKAEENLRKANSLPPD